MRRAAQVLLLAAAGALVAPAVAEACWSGYYCESYGYDAGGYVYGYSRTYGYYGTYFLVETSITDSQWSTVSNWAEGMFDVTAEVWMDAGSGGDYYIEGNHYSNEWEGWYYDGTSYYSVYVQPPPPPPQITVCPVPSPPWGSGSQSAVIGGSGFWGNTPQVSWSGNGGVNFLQWSDASVASDSQIDLSVSLAPVNSDGSITLGVGTAACVIPVFAAAQPPSCGDGLKDMLIAEYYTYNVTWKPSCSDVTSPWGTANFSASAINIGNDYSGIWTITKSDLLTGLENIRAAAGNLAMPVSSGYRNPKHNHDMIPPGKQNSRHLHGIAADITETDTTRRDLLRSTGHQYGACVEPFGYTPTWVHLDWRPANQCPANW